MNHDKTGSSLKSGKCISKITDTVVTNPGEKQLLIWINKIQLVLLRYNLLKSRAIWELAQRNTREPLVLVADKDINFVVG